MEESVWNGEGEVSKRSLPKFEQQIHYESEIGDWAP